ncbi:trypsin-like peptidase domain-containing protein [candidate division KSB1 bacterium]|nr:trypsin-like peptidase domain-containing protein [candidate division KSB1 bacterium]
MSYARLMFKELFICGIMLLVVGTITTAAGLPHPQSVPQIQDSLSSAAGESEEVKHVDLLAQWREWFRQHEAEAKPIRVPLMRENLGGETPDNELIYYDLLTRETHTIANASIPSLPTPSMPGFAGPDYPRHERGESPLDAFNYPIEIQDPSLWPWRVNCKIYIYAEGGPYQGSAILIDDQHVLTAAHCVWDGGHDQWVDQIEVIPAFDEGDRPYGDALSVGFMTYASWINNPNSEWDLAVVELDRPVGALTGWFPTNFRTDPNFYLTNTFHNAAYAAPPPFDGVRLAYRFGPYDSVSTHVLWELDTTAFGGMSGGGVYQIEGGYRQVYAVVSGGYIGYGTFCRITGTKQTDITNYIVSHHQEGADLGALDCNVSPESLPLGTTPSVVDFLLYNHSLSDTFTGSVDATLYLSTNDFISTSDLALDTRTFSVDLEPATSARLNWTDPPQIACYISPGTRWIGVVLGLTDANSSNNSTSGQDAAEVSIVSAPPSAANDPAPESGNTGVLLTTNLAWTAGTCAQSHDVYFGHTNPPPLVGNQSGDEYDPPGNLWYASQYYWRIDEVNSTGTTPGPLWTFTTVFPPLPPQAAQPDPADQATAVPVNVVVSWSAGAGYTETFDVYFGTTNPPPLVLTNTPIQSYDPPGELPFFTSHFWRIDSRNASGVTPGTVWRFTTWREPPEAASNPSPVNGALEVPVTTLLSWTVGARTTYNWLYLGTTNPPPFVSTPYNPNYDPILNYGTAYYWRIDEVNSGGTTPGPLWTFTTAVFVAPPGLPTNPDPADGATGVSIYTGLAFTPGDGASSHELWVEEEGTFYLWSSVADPVIPWPGVGPLEPFSTFNWRIREINSAGGTWGPIWSFTAGEFELAGAPSELTIKIHGSVAILHWAPAVHDWSYYVHHSTDPGFVPGPTNVVATVWDTTWTDTTVFSTPSERRFYAISNTYP